MKVIACINNEAKLQILDSVPQNAPQLSLLLSLQS